MKNKDKSSLKCSGSDRIFYNLFISVISVSQPVSSTSNDVTYVPDSQFQPSRMYLDRSAGEAGGQRDIDLTLTGHKYCNNYRNIQGHEGWCIIILNLSCPMGKPTICIGEKQRRRSASR